MDQAKATINLKEGVIQLEGPLEFVQKYLDVYQPVIKKATRLLSTRELAPAADVVSEPAGKVARRSAKRAAKRISCAERIRAGAAGGFFKDGKSMREVKVRLTEEGLVCSDNAVRASLKRLSEAGLLNRTGKGRNVRYQHD